MAGQLYAHIAKRFIQQNVNPFRAKLLANILGEHNFIALGIC